MAKAARAGDSGSGHECFPSSPVISGSPNVSINGQPAARVGDSVQIHACTCPQMPHGMHRRTISEGSSTVSINGKPAARMGDALSCGGVIESGSNNVFIGDTPWRSPVHECIAQAVKEGASMLKISPMPEEPPPPVVTLVFAKSCLRGAGNTDAGTEDEPCANFGAMSFYLSAAPSALQMADNEPGQSVLPDNQGETAYPQGKKP